LTSLLCFALLCFALLCFALLCFALLCFALLVSGSSTKHYARLFQECSENPMSNTFDYCIAPFFLCDFLCAFFAKSGDFNASIVIEFYEVHLHASYNSYSFPLE